ncbi:AAA family ATPase [Dactylosporangium sp. CA-233914]|uniref:AAA family ATPase n=1 Tax=Dactylosporangium sp. CA-233914 TaxID=3239934 RepID=UPI003D91A51C
MSGEPTDNDWLIYRGGDTRPHDGVATRLPAPPPWRTFEGEPLVPPLEIPSDDLPDTAGRRLGVMARSYRPDPHTVALVNAALYLRRPLLVTGKAGVGKSSLARSVARELRLGPVLHWPITSRSAIGDGLYHYDALARLQEANFRKLGGDGPVRVPETGRYIQLGPLGTALLPTALPRVLLIDEMDKSDIDLPNDLLNVFEDGGFAVPELSRLPEDPPVSEVTTADGRRVEIRGGRVACHAFPFVVITSNGEREFPVAFLRRCIRLDMAPPSRDRLAEIIAAQLGEAALERSEEIIDRFLDRREKRDIATDQLLNAIYLATSAGNGRPLAPEMERALLRPLGDNGQ